MKNVSFSKQLSCSKDENLSLNLSRVGNDTGSLNLLHSPISTKVNKSDKIDSVVTNSELTTFKHLFNQSSKVGHLIDYKSGQYSTIGNHNYNSSNSLNRYNNMDSISDYNN